MAFGPGAAGGNRRGRRRGRPRQTLSEINVTPLVDVMLVLLIIFMISAPLLASGVEVNTPKTEAGAVKDQNEPLTVTIRKDGSIYVQDSAVPFDRLAPVLSALAGQAKEKPIFVRADAAASYDSVAKVMARLSVSGFTKINLMTDPLPTTEAPGAGLKPLVQPTTAP